MRHTPLVSAVSRPGIRDTKVTRNDTKVTNHEGQFIVLRDPRVSFVTIVFVVDGI